MQAAPHRQSFLPHPLAVLAASLALGIIIARFKLLPHGPVLWGCGLCSLATLYGFIKRRSLLTSSLLMASFFLMGALLLDTANSVRMVGSLGRLYDEGVIKSGEPVELTGVIERAPEPAPDGFYLTLKVERLSFKGLEREVFGRVMFFATAVDSATLREYEVLELRYGARVRVMTALNRQEQFRNPGVSSLTEYLEGRSLEATATIKSPLLIERLDDERVVLPLVWLYEWRSWSLAEIDKNYSTETGGVLKAALFGNRYHLSRATSERFREGGTFHVLVISGLHISFIGGLLLFLLRRVTRRRLWQFIVPVGFLWAYTLMVGAEVSVVRAALMFTLVALASVTHRRASSLNALGAATLVLLVWRPADLFDPSFQLTFLSVLAIIVISWPLIERIREIGSWRPTLQTPCPPRCPRLVRLFGETLFWREGDWRLELARSSYSYRLFKTPWAARLERLRLQRVLRYAFSAILVSASVQLMLLPLLVIYFHRLSWASLVLNIMVGVLMAGLALTALAALILSQLSVWLATPLFKLAEALNWLMVHSVDPFSAAGIASSRLPEYTGWPAGIYVIYYAPLLLLTLALARWTPVSRTMITKETEQRTFFLLRPKLAASVLVLLCALIILHPFSASGTRGRLRIDFLDVGQGDATLVTMPDGTTLLIDAGGRPRFVDARRQADEGGVGETFERDTRSIGEAVVSEYIWWRGLDRVDYLLATHADADHMDGLNDVARNFKVRAALIARAPAADVEFVRFARTTREENIPLRLIGRGDVLRFGAVEITTLWPERSENPKAPSSNDASIVLRLRFGERVFLLTGDIEKDAEAALASFGDDLRCDVLKVAHHGSKTSSTDGFIKATEAKLAIIPVGLNSIFGHPHKEVLERLRSSGAEILTTGQRGTITLTTDGHDLQVETFVK